VVAPPRTIAPARFLRLLATVALPLLGLLLTFLTRSAVILLTRTNLRDLVRAALTAFVFGRNRNVVVAILDRRKVLHAVSIARKLEHQLAVVVDLDAVGAVHRLPLQSQATAVVLNDARVDLAFAVDARSAAVGGSGLPAATADRRHRNANGLLLDVANDNAVVAASDLDNPVVIVRTAFAAIARLRAARRGRA